MPGTSLVVVWLFISAWHPGDVAVIARSAAPFRAADGGKANPLFALPFGTPVHVEAETHSDFVEVQIDVEPRSRGFVATSDLRVDSAAPSDAETRWLRHPCAYGGDSCGSNQTTTREAVERNAFFNRGGGEEAWVRLWQAFSQPIYKKTPVALLAALPFAKPTDTTVEAGGDDSSCIPEPSFDRARAPKLRRLGGRMTELSNHKVSFANGAGETPNDLGRFVSGRNDARVERLAGGGFLFSWPATKIVVVVLDPNNVVPPVVSAISVTAEAKVSSGDSLITFGTDYDSFTHYAIAMWSDSPGWADAFAKELNRARFAVDGPPRTVMCGRDAGSYTQLIWHGRTRSEAALLVFDRLDAGTPGSGFESIQVFVSDGDTFGRLKVLYQQEDDP